jgi:hypothetical protein
MTNPVKNFIKSILNRLGFSKLYIFPSKVKKVLFRILHKSRIFEKLSGYFGFFTVQSVSETELKSLLKFLVPINNGHKLIRVGSDGDGGYLLPDDLNDIKYCFSPGAGAVWTFEQEIGSRFGIKSLICDGTIETFPSFEHLHSFTPMNVGPLREEKIIAFSDWVDEVGQGTEDLILQMDIEGGEYPILNSIDDKLLEKFRVIILELHDLHLLAIPSGFSIQYKTLVNKLTTNFDVVHLHPNYSGSVFFFKKIMLPKVVEITLHRKDRAITYSEKELPHNLDSANDPKLGEFPNFEFIEWIKNEEGFSKS